MEPKEQPLLFPQELNFSCHMCSGCCRGWNVIVSDAEAAQFEHHDWAAARERLRGLDIFKPLKDGRRRLNHIGDACVFLDDDNLCAIHKEIGFDRKPQMCKQFPYYPVETPDGIVASVDFACPSVVAGRGEPIRLQEADFRQVIADARAVAAVAARPSNNVRPSFSATESHVEARRGVPLAWADYLALESTLRKLLNDSKPLTQRLIMMDWLIKESPQHAAAGEMSTWTDSMTANAWRELAIAATAPRVTSLRQRAFVAPVVSLMEYAWARALEMQTSTLARVGLALAIVPSQKPVYLHTAEATLDLAKMRRVHFAQDDPALTAVIARFLEAFLVRKSLIAGTTVAQGGRYLSIYVAVLRWYAVARAALAERDQVEETDIHYALRLVERTLSHADGLKSPRILSLVDLVFDRVTPSAALYPSYYPV